MSNAVVFGSIHTTLTILDPGGTPTVRYIIDPCGIADVGSQGGVAGADGVLDNSDFVVFIDRFFAGC